MNDRIEKGIENHLKMESFYNGLEQLVKKYEIDKFCNIPDYLLAGYLYDSVFKLREFADDLNNWKLANSIENDNKANS